MSLSREDMLRELELLPVWHLRHPLAVPVDEQVQTVKQQSVVAEQAVANADPTLPMAGDLVVVASEQQAPAIAQIEVASTLPHQADGMQPDADYWDAMQLSPEFADSVPPPFEPAVSTPQPDRRTTIMAMDWQALQQDVPECEACHLAETRTQTVFGVGDPNAEWLFVGEAPGAEEDRRGEPFVGPAGQLLDNMLKAIALKRGENVYIANVLKCRPPANRDPQGEEVVKCDPYLKRQVELIQPKLIVALGKFAAQSLLASDKSIASMRGTLHDFHGVPVIVTYHPAYLLRNMPDKARAWDDLCFARDTMQGLQSAAVTPSE